MISSNLSFLESVSDETVTIGGFNYGNDKNDFDQCFKEACEELKIAGVDPMVDINTIIRQPDIASTFKTALLKGIMEESVNYKDSDIYGNYACLDDQVDKLFDNVTNQLVRESTTVGQLMPIKAIDYPILMKQHLQLATKDVMQTEVTTNPLIKKQIERRWIVDNQTGERWEYPQCFYDQSVAEKIFASGKGLPISSEPVEIPTFNFDLIGERTDSATPQRESLTFNTKIVAGVLEDGTEIPMNCYVDLHHSSWVNGMVDTDVTLKDDSVEHITDQIYGGIDFVSKTVTVVAANSKIKKVVFSGYLSNELNERAVSMDYTRMEREWKIEDGHRVNVPYSVEELEDAKALLDIDLYKKTYDNMATYLTDMEDSQIISFLDEEYAKYAGVELDPLGWNSMVREINFDCDSTIKTTALPCEYIAKQLKFTIDRFVIDLTETCKMEDMTFVMYGNPRWISLLGDEVKWVITNGQMTGGVRHNYSYGIMNTGHVRIQVVSALKFSPDDDMHQGIRFIPYPMSKEQMTFKHYKYSTHILTTQNSGYKAPDRPGGSMTNILGVSRYESASIQGIQGLLTFTNADFIKSQPAKKRG